MRLLTDIVYRSDHERGKLDVMMPPGKPPFPVVVVIHGGGWKDGAKEDARRFGEIAAGMGMAAVIPNYHLTGTHPHPAQEEDVFSVLDWMADQASAFGFDPRRVGLTGVSAGGHLAALTGLKAIRYSDARWTLRCMMPICGVHDVGLWSREKPVYTSYVEAFLGGPVSAKTTEERDSSPVAHVHPHAPPCLAVHGEQDETVPFNQSVLLVQALRAVDAVAELILVPGVGHAAFMPETNPVEPLGGMAVFQAFMRKYLAAEKPHEC